MFKTDVQVSRPAGYGGKWLLLQDLIYVGLRDTFVVPKGFETDFASIPSFLTFLIPKNGTYDAAAIVHDYLYAEQPLVCKRNHCNPLETHRITRRDADRVFHRIMGELGVPATQALILYLGVRLGGWLIWHRNRSEFLDV